MRARERESDVFMKRAVKFVARERKRDRGKAESR